MHAGPAAAALAGRDREKAVIDGFLSRAAQGRGGVLVVTGPPGSGRTEIAAAATLGARRGFEVLSASPGLGRPERLVWAQLLREVGARPGWDVAFDAVAFNCA